MYFFDCANLYVEKYTNEDLILDFIMENEFICFRNNDNFIENMRLFEYSPTMLLFHSVKKINVSEGDILTIPMKELIKHKEKNSKLFQSRLEEEQPYGVFFTFVDSGWLESLFLAGIAYKNNGLRAKLVEHFEGTWTNGKPCALEYLKDNVCVEVVDVGQGNTNLIYDNNSLAIFDFGANMFATKSELESIVNSIKKRFDDFHVVSLVISHWDYDHYNLLTVIDENSLNNICCVFIPSDVISLTTKQIVNKLKRNCQYIRSFSSPYPKTRGNVGIVPIIINDRYELYIGEKCKDKNKSGLLLSIKGNNDIVVLGADHTNRQISCCINSLVDSNKKHKTLNIIVPHHGGHCGKIKNISCSKPGIAAVSVGKNSYKHPNQSTIDMYRKIGFKVLRTDWERRNIKIEIK